MTIDELHKLWDKTNRGKAANSEHGLQVACVQWFRYTYPREIIMAIPNGGYRSPKTAAIMKAEGQLAGVPDLFIPAARGECHGLWIEMKNGKAGRVSDRQTEMMRELTEQGYQCAVCRTFYEFEKTVSEYLQPVL